MSEPRAFKIILVPIDFSEGARDALDRAVELTGGGQGELILLHVVEPAVIPTIFAEQSVAAVDLGAWTERAEQLMAGLAAELRTKGVRVRTLVHPGHPGTAIVDTALSENADLIVIGSSGHRSAAYAIFGSTVERVTRKAPCPVLVTRKKAVRAPIHA